MAETIEQIAQRVARKMYGRFARAEDTYEPHVEFAKALVAELAKEQKPVAIVRRGVNSFSLLDTTGLDGIDGLPDGAAIYARPFVAALAVLPDAKFPVGGLDHGWMGEFNRGWNACRESMLSAEHTVCANDGRNDADHHQDALLSALEFAREKIAELHIEAGDGDCHYPMIDDAIASAKRAAPAAPAADSVTIYAECRQCDSCYHAGINDSGSVKAACLDCEWRGVSPNEDKCPECGGEGCMTVACPKCGGRYRLIADGNIDAAMAASREARQ